MAYALLVERLQQQVSTLNMSAVVAASMGAAQTVDLVTVDDLIADLDASLNTADMPALPAAHAVVLEALGVGRGR